MAEGHGQENCGKPPAGNPYPGLLGTVEARTSGHSLARPIIGLASDLDLRVYFDESSL